MGDSATRERGDENGGGLSLGPHGMGLVGVELIRSKGMGAGAPQGSGSRATWDWDGHSTRRQFLGYRG
jgi:hypothetical protein